ncbi:hypothetical protein BV378_03970 [Nostoc sp. RF31YmG]|nr:hypothetical protein BV378_03970 [Nostoc sp. RF31YmG]
MNTGFGLSSAQRASLKALGIRVAVPTYIPRGFKISQVIAERCLSNQPHRELCSEGPYYSIIYRDYTNTCLLINAFSGGVGGGDDEYQFSTKTKLLGEITIGFNPVRGSGKIPTQQQLGKVPKPEQLMVPQPELSSFPAMSVAQRSPYYNAVSSGSQYYRQTYGCGKNRSITPLELEKILQSLIWLN